MERFFGHLRGLFGIVVQEGQQGLGKADQIPLRYVRLVRIGITAPAVD